jgi:hypothetical protein
LHEYPTADCSKPWDDEKKAWRCYKIFCKKIMNGSLDSTSAPGRLMKGQQVRAESVFVYKNNGSNDRPKSQC